MSSSYAVSVHLRLMVVITLLALTRLAIAQSNPIALAQQHLLDAIDNQSANLPGYGDDLRKVANELADLGLFGDAQAAVSSLLANPENPFDQITGLMIQAQYSGVLGGPSASLTAWRYALSVCNGNEDLRAYFPDLYADVYGKTALAKFYVGDAAGALAMINNQLVGHADALTLDQRLTALVNKAAFAKALANNTEVVSAITSLFTLSPTFGQDNGTWVELRLSQYAAEDNGANGQSFVANLASLWNDAAAGGFPQSQEVGRALAAVYSAREQDALACDVAANALARLDAHKSSWLLMRIPACGPDWADQMEMDWLTRLQTANAYGRSWLALWSHFRMLMRDDLPNEQLTMLLDSYNSINREMFANDNSLPPNGQGIFPASSNQVHPELATILTSTFASEEKVAAKIVSVGPLRFNSSTDWTTGFYIYAGDESLEHWTPVSCFLVRAPTDSAVNSPSSVGISRAPNTFVHPGIYAIAPKPNIRWDLGPSVALVDCPPVAWPEGLDSGPGAPVGVYYFRVGQDCDEDGANDLLQIIAGRASTPPVELDHNNNGTLDSCELGDCCRADFNADHVVTVQDIFDFLAAWFASAPAADMDLNGTIDILDVFSFLNTWFSYNPAKPC